MKKYDALKEAYNQLVIETLNQNKQILIDSFVEYYGEEYRDLITRKYNEITFIYFADWYSLELLAHKMSNYKNNTLEYQTLKEFLKCHQKKSSIFSTTFQRKEPSIFPDELIGTTNYSVVSKEKVRNFITSYLTNNYHYSVNIGVNPTDRIVSFSILSLTEKAIIHEINHALTKNHLAEINDNGKHIGWVEKSGISAAIKGKSEDICLEELLNDKASTEIIEIFKRKGGNLTSICLGNPVPYSYPANFYLIDDFYEMFKEYIKKARILEAKNELIARVGEATYQKFANLVQYRYSNNLETIKKNKRESMDQVEALLKQMQNNARNATNLTRESLESFYNELRAMGANVRVINVLNDDIPENNPSISRK